MPQPTAIPADFRIVRAAARTRNDDIMPAADAKKLNLTALFSDPPWPTTLRTLIESTGSTQGIKFKISPPKIPKARIYKIETSALELEGGAWAVGPNKGSPMISFCSALRLPSTRVTVNSRPLIVFPTSSSKNFNPSTSTSNKAVRWSGPRVTLGLVNVSSSGPSK